MKIIRKYFQRFKNILLQGKYEKCGGGGGGGYILEDLRIYCYKGNMKSMANIFDGNNNYWEYIKEKTQLVCLTYLGFADRSITGLADMFFSLVTFSTLLSAMSAKLGDDSDRFNDGLLSMLGDDWGGDVCLFALFGSSRRRLSF